MVAAGAYRAVGSAANGPATARAGVCFSRGNVMELYGFMMSVGTWEAICWQIAMKRLLGVGGGATMRHHKATLAVTWIR